ncbi:hypothetical protein [Orlajensenia flava]|uniref:hypothetical protein n=1 Tax=Orlajensenia flava TaxID=2565934 RepID=UPI00145514C3|nr:hypothetical protein [Glaciibacter flavus]
MGWCVAIGVVLSVPLMVRWWRAEMLRGDDEQYEATSAAARYAGRVRRKRAKHRSADPE